MAKTKQSLLNYLSDIDSSRVGLTKEELSYLATIGNENYLYLINNVQWVWKY